ncbi:MAG TPA: site-2 protease family protein [Solirubrobacteraceae bacterium]|jgi:Zn-dependent protease|nr:site-2 protease family protein [Solirubrobacteraceae bacterium]
MKPRTNFQLARIFGIRVGVGFSWFVVLFIFIIFITPIFHDQLGGSRTTAYLVAVASVLSFFASLVLHELGHALVARRSGLRVAGIDLWALGGTTRTEEAKDPGAEFRVAAAGPLVTLLVIVACIVAGRVLTDSKTFFELAVAEEGTRATPVLVWLSWLATINVLVLVFNLVPAFPLDGGRIAHAAIWWRTGDRNRATHATGRAGQGFALLLGAAGLWWLATGAGSAGLACILLAYFLYQAAGAAVVQGQLARRIQSITVADIMDRQPVTIPASATLLDAHEDFFLRYRWSWFAVVDPARHFLGVVAAARVDAEISAGRPALPVIDVLEEDMHVRIDEAEPLESLLGSEGLGRLGAMVAVDRDGVLQGVVTLAEVRKALRVAT